MFLRNLSIACCLLAVMNVQAQDIVQFKSKPQQTMMIELYSSQGCSSCPPAERWLSKFLDDDDLWENSVPIVFHVDYWDDLGWADPFASAENSKRQRIYHQQGGVNSVYTPGFIINGREWRGGKYTMSEMPPGVLQASLKGRELKVQFENKENLELHVSVLGIGFKTDVKHGENSDEILKEDFVALSHQKLSSDKGEWKINLSDIKQKNAARYALAIWVSHPGKNAPIQSTGGWLPQKMFGG